MLAHKSAILISLLAVAIAAPIKRDTQISGPVAPKDSQTTSFSDQTPSTESLASAIPDLISAAAKLAGHGSLKDARTVPMEVPDFGAPGAPSAPTTVRDRSFVASIPSIPVMVPGPDGAKAAASVLVTDLGHLESSVSGFGSATLVKARNDVGQDALLNSNPTLASLKKQIDDLKAHQDTVTSLPSALAKDASAVRHAISASKAAKVLSPASLLSRTEALPTNSQPIDSSAVTGTGLPKLDSLPALPKLPFSGLETFPGMVLPKDDDRR